MSCGFRDTLSRISFVREEILKTMAAWVGAGALAFGIGVGGVTVHVATAQAAAVQSCGQLRRRLLPSHHVRASCASAQPVGLELGLLC